MDVDDALTDGTVEERVLFGVKPDEVFGAVVEPIAVEMMAYLSGFGHAPKGGTDEQVNISIFATDTNMIIIATMG